MSVAFARRRGSGRRQRSIHRAPPMRHRVLAPRPSSVGSWIRCGCRSIQPHTSRHQHIARRPSPVVYRPSPVAHHRPSRRRASSRFVRARPVRRPLRRRASIGAHAAVHHTTSCARRRRPWPGGSGGDGGGAGLGRGGAPDAGGRRPENASLRSLGQRDVPRFRDHRPPPPELRTAPGRGTEHPAP